MALAYHSSQPLCSATQMARVFVMLACVCLQFGYSTETPPRVTECRIVVKAKQQSGNITWLHVFPSGHSCQPEIVFPISGDSVLNFADPRNCENYYTCSGLTCSQCPCPENQAFDPVTSTCTSEPVQCTCPTLPALHPTSPTTNQQIKKQTVPEQTEIVVPSNQQTQSKTERIAETPTTSSQQSISNGTIIVSGIVSATVLVIVLLLIGFILWQMNMCPPRKKPQMVPSNNDGYLHTLPVQERHVYAEIDEQMISGRNEKKHIDTNSPPLPSNPPACVHHPHQTFMLPTTFPQKLHSSFNSHQIYLPSTQCRDSRNGSCAAADHSLGSPIDGCDSSSVTSCSGCSHCSATSSHNQFDSSDSFDRRTLLHRSNPHVPSLAPFNYVSRQVYI